MSNLSVTEHGSRPSLELLEGRDLPSVVVANFSDGLWRHDTATNSWAHLTVFQASESDVDDGGNVYARFSTGLWRWGASSASWQLLSNLTMTSMEVNGGGTLVGNFTGQGLWRWDAANGWARFSFLKPDHLAISESNAVFAVYSSSGTWRYTPTAGWSLLTESRPDGSQFDTDDAGNFVGKFNLNIGAGQQGSWRWTAAAGWARLSNVVAYQLAVSEAGQVYEDRGLNGIWAYNPAAANAVLASISASNSSALATTAEGGVASWIYDAGTMKFKMWYYAPAAGWSLASADVQPEDAACGAANEVFVDRAAQGLWAWSSALGFRQLSVRNPT